MTGSLASYPLEAVRQRERWALEALQSQLATATASHAKRFDQHSDMLRALSQAAAAAMPTTGCTIEPHTLRRRLQHMAEQHRATAAAAREVASLDESSTLLRQAVMRQHMRLESVNRHRPRFIKDKATTAERIQQAEVDRDWLARSLWRGRADVGTPTVGTPGRAQADRAGR